MAAQSMAVGLAGLEALNFSTTLWLFVAAFVLHEVEEWNITAFERRNFVDLPVTFTEANGRAWLIFVCVIAVTWCAVATLPGNPKLAAFVVLPAVALAMANALQHVFWTIYFRQYAPGVVTAVLLLLPLGVLAFIIATHRQLVPLWYVLGLAMPVAMVVGHTVWNGRRPTAPMLGIYALGGRISRLIGRAQVPIRRRSRLQAEVRAVRRSARQR